MPPFESFYVEHRGVVLGFLRRRLGAQAAETRFQETFLRALRAYDRLEHGDHLRAWVLTIAARLVIDSAAARSLSWTSCELPVEDGRPAYAQIEHLAGGLPPTERAAVVLRYAYDLPMTTSPRRWEHPEPRAGRLLRGPATTQEKDRMTETVILSSTSASARRPRPRLLDVGFDVIESPVGPLLGRDRPRAGADLVLRRARACTSSSSRAYRPRVLRSARSVDSVLPARRVLRRTAERLRGRARPPRHRVRPVTCSRSSPHVPYGQTTTYGTLANRVGAPRAARAVGTVMHRNPIPIVLPCHRVVGANGSLTGYGGGLHVKEQLLRLEGALL